MGVDIHELIQELEWYQKNKIPDIQPEYLDDIITVLKAQEPVEPKVIVYHIFLDGTCDISPRMVTCGACGERLIENSDVVPRYKFCPQCGRAVRWT